MKHPTARAINELSPNLGIVFSFISTLLFSASISLVCGKRNATKGLFFYHVPGTGGSTFESAAAHYACRNGLSLLNKYKGLSIAHIGKVIESDVIASHVDQISVMQIWKKHHQNGLRLSIFVEPVKATVKALRGVDNPDYLFGFNRHFEYLFNNAWPHKGNSMNRTLLTIRQAKELINQNLDWVGTSGGFQGDYDFFYASTGELLGNVSSLLYKTVHNTSVCSADLNKELSPSPASVREYLISSTKSFCLLSPNHDANLCNDIVNAIKDTKSLDNTLKYIPHDEDTVFLYPDVALFLAAKKLVSARFSEKDVEKLGKEYRNYKERFQNRHRTTEPCCNKQCSRVYVNERFYRDSGCDKKIVLINKS